MLNLFAKEEILQFTKTANNQKKIGETIQLANDTDNFFETIENSSAQFVIIGIPEDIGMKVSGEKGGAHYAFMPTIEALVNIQENQFLSGKDILALGYLDYSETVNNFIADDAEKGDYLVKQLDKDVSELIHFLASAGKTPIVIGGGQNNAYGILKGIATAKNQKINAVNLDNHTDLDELNERNSRNPFSYAINDGYLDRYFMFGLHENDTPQHIFDIIQEHINIEYNMFEEMEVYKSTSFKNELQRAKQFVSKQPYGIEIDVDALQAFGNNNSTSLTGITPQQARRFVYYLGQEVNASYLHISESIPNTENNNAVGKFISYLITDFIKAKNNIQPQ